MSLDQYRIVYSGGISPGTVPGPMTFKQLGVTAAKVVTDNGGGDYAEITVDANFAATAMPFLPLARHDLYAPGGTAPIFSGWLIQPGRSATGNRQQQTFRIDGPACWLTAKPYLTVWQVPIASGTYGSATSDVQLSRTILNGGDTKVAVADQVAQIMASAIAQGAPVACGDTSLIPTVRAPEDETSDMTCAALVKRSLAWTPMVAAFWDYSSGTPTLQFTARAAATAAGAGVISIDLRDGTLETFESKPRYDLLVRKVTVSYQTDASPVSNSDGTDIRIPLEVSTDTATADPVTASFKDIFITHQLRPLTKDSPGESIPVGVAAALLAPFAALTHEMTWSQTAADVDWSTVPGMAVRLVNPTDTPLNGARSIVQQIQRDLARGTTSYKAGTPGGLGLDDLIALQRIAWIRGPARTEKQKQTPQQQQFGFKKKDPDKDPPSSDGGGSTSPLAQRCWTVAVNGQVEYALFNSSAPMSSAPSGTVQNPY